MTLDSKAQVVRHLQEEGYEFTGAEWSGGFAYVLGARQNGVDKAVKIYEPLDESAGAAAELKTLQEISCHLKHPHILALFDIHKIPIDGKQYFATAWQLGTKTLKDEVSEARNRETPLTATQIVTYLRVIAEALDYLHDRGIYHCDVKPQNMLFVNGYLRLSDFGMAKLAGLTKTAVVGGTPGYSPPGGAPSPAYDVYSLAASYVWCRTGEAHYRSVNELQSAGMLPGEAEWVAQAFDLTKGSSVEAVDFLDGLRKTLEPARDTRLRLAAIVLAAMTILGIPLGMGIWRMNGQATKESAESPPPPRNIEPKSQVRIDSILDNEGSPTLVLKQAGSDLHLPADPRNHLGFAAVGTGVRVLETKIINTAIAFKKIEILDGELKGKIGWVSKNCVHPLRNTP